MAVLSDLETCRLLREVTMTRWILALIAVLVVGIGCSKQAEEPPPPASPPAPPAPVIPEVAGRFDLKQSNFRIDFFETTNATDGRYVTTEIQADGSSLYVLRHFIAKDKRPETFLEIYELKTAQLIKTIGLTVGQKNFCSPTRFQIEGAKLYMRGVGCIFVLNKDSEVVEEHREIQWELKNGVSEEELAASTFGESESLIIEGENIYLPIGVRSAAAFWNSAAWDGCRSLRPFLGKKFHCRPIYSSLQIRSNGTHLFFLSQKMRKSGDGVDHPSSEEERDSSENGNLSENRDANDDSNSNEEENGRVAKRDRYAPEMRLFKKKKDRSGKWDPYFGVEPVLAHSYHILNFFINGNVLYLLGIDSQRGPMVKKYSMDATSSNLTYISEKEVVDITDDRAVMVVIHNKIIIGQSDQIFSMADF